MNKVIIDKDGPVKTIWMNRPEKRNALDSELLREMIEALQAPVADDDRVMVIRGKGQCLVGDRAYDIGMRDLVSVPPMTWHQFRAADDAPLGFLCLVAADRDRPQQPGADEAADIAAPLKR